MSPTSLFLAPTESERAAPRDAVVALLRELAIIDGPLDDGRFLAGEGFARHVVFAGCSPHLVMTPPADGGQAFCHVGVHGPLAAPLLVTDPQAPKPRCPACRTRVDGWRERLRAACPEQGAWDCTGCGLPLTPCTLDWRQHALCGRFLIELHNVFPGEAAPSDRLMRRLEETLGAPWQFAWAASRPATAPIDQSTTT
jgi:hypothetical protein